MRYLVEGLDYVYMTGIKIISACISISTYLDEVANAMTRACSSPLI